MAWVGFARLGLFLTPKDTKNFLQGILFFVFVLYFRGAGFGSLPGRGWRPIGVVLGGAYALRFAVFLVATTAENMREERAGGRDDSLPAAVQSGLQAKTGSDKLGKVESITKHDKLVAYEAKVMTNGKRSEIQVGPDGKPLDHEE